MAIFKDGKQMEEIFGDLWSRLLKETELGEKLKESGISVLYKLSEPEVVMYIDENGPLFGDEALQKTPVVTMTMKGDIVHKFWLKQINVPKALALRQIKAKGPVPKVLKLLPLLKPGMEKYPSICEKYNLPMD